MSGNNETVEERARRIKRKRALDEAFRAYVADMIDEGVMKPGMCTGWVAGIATTHYDEEGEELDGMVTESSPGINNYMARGLADSTAEGFAAQANGWNEDEE